MADAEKKEEMDKGLELLLSAFLGATFGRIAQSRRFWEFLTKNYVDQALLEEIRTRLLSVKAILGDAEQRHVADPFVKDWVDEIREAVYDADDVLDEIDNKALHGSHTVLDKVTDSLLSLEEPLSEGMRSKLLRINGRLKSIVEHRHLLDLKEGGGKTTLLSMPTTCLINEHEVYGRDGERDSIINKLLSLNEENQNHVSVIAIVGMAGMGKTTLSQMVYNHPRVENHFNVRSWVHISEGSNVFEVTKKIYDSLTGFNSNIRELNSLQLKLKSKLKRKRFLLVLDDYWAEDFIDWDLLKMPLESGDHGSCIIVTTRNESVALTMHAAETYLLPDLSDEACWQLFAHHAFRSRDPEASPTLKEIGERIVSKCKGHPLSVKTLGSLLTFKTEAKDWNNILQSKVWDLPVHKSNILPALMLSYRHLPGHLKRCFAYCSIFPKGHRNSKRNLIHLWMAEGLVRSESKNEETMEEVAEECFHELSSRSFLQSDNSSFTMHDLMIDLAQHIGGEFFHKLEHNDPQQVPKKVRHLSFLLDELDGLEKLGALFDLSQLRTFLPLRLSNPGPSQSIVGFVNLLLSKRRCLRVLSLSNYPISSLSDSIGSFEHLRYLNLSHTLLERLPDSVKDLYNLQTLLLLQCKCLTELPTNLQQLTNLHHLDISGTKLSKISELGALSKLRGALSIENLQNIDPTHASKANLKEKKFLDELELKWADGVHNLMQEGSVLHNLQPHTNLKGLKIEHYGGKLFPGWFGDSSFCNMVSVHLVSCETCSLLPPLGQLPYLETLHIENMTGLEVVNPTFFGNHGRPFSSLESLTFKNMPNWEQWVLDAGREFPSLQLFHIEGCPRLGGSLPRVPALQELKLDGCNVLVYLPEQMMQGNTSVIISGCPRLVPLCQRDTGSYWRLVSGLGRLEIDGEVIPLATEEQ